MAAGGCYIVETPVKGLCVLLLHRARVVVSLSGLGVFSPSPLSPHVDSVIAHENRVPIEKHRHCLPSAIREIDSLWGEFVRSASGRRGGVTEPDVRDAPAIKTAGVKSGEVEKPTGNSSSGSSSQDEAITSRDRS